MNAEKAIVGQIDKAHKNVSCLKSLIIRYVIHQSVLNGK